MRSQSLKITTYASKPKSPKKVSLFNLQQYIKRNSSQDSGANSIELEDEKSAESVDQRAYQNNSSSVHLSDNNSSKD